MHGACWPWSDEAAMAFATAGPAGSVRLGVMDDYATRILPALLSDFLRRTPRGQAGGADGTDRRDAAETGPRS